MKKISIHFIISALYGAGFGAAFYWNIIVLEKLSVVTYKLNFYADAGEVALLLRCMVCGAVLGMGVLYLYIRKCRNDFAKAAEFSKALCPLIILLPMLLLPPGFYNILVMAAVIGLAVFRLMLIWPGVDGFERKLDGRYNIWIVCALFAVITVYLALVQWKGLKVMALTFNDWGVYYEAALNTLQGKWFYSDHGDKNFLAEHFIPGVILLISPVVWIAQGKFYIFFWFSSALICCGSIFAYLWGRKMNIPSGAALLLAIAVLIYPSLSNMNFCIYYGFHDIYVIFPFLYLFCWLYESKRMWWAFGLFFLTLFIKETVPVFWMGMGAMIFVSGKRKWGAAYFLVAAAYFVLIMGYVMPSLNTAYAYDGRFSMLGANAVEIAMSPFTRPEVFFKLLFRPGTFYFLGTLLIPLGLLSLCQPKLLFPGLIIVGAICLQDTDQHQNIAMAYQTEFVAMNFAAMVLAYRKINDGKIFYFHRILAYGLDAGALKSALLIAVLVTTAVSYYFFGFSLYGKQSIRGIFAVPDRDREIREISASLPKNSRVQASERLASFFLMDHTMRLTVSGFNPDNEYIIFDLRDSFAYRFIDPLRFKLLRDPDYTLIQNEVLANYCWIMMFKREPRKVEIPSTLTKMSNMEWLGKGQLTPVRNEAYEARYELLPGRLRFHVRLLRPVEHDVDIILQIIGTQGTDYQTWQFGHGTSPAPLASPGEVYTFEYQIPAELGDVKQMQLDLRDR